MPVLLLDDHVFEDITFHIPWPQLSLQLHVVHCLSPRLVHVDVEHRLVVELCLAAGKLLLHFVGDARYPLANAFRQLHHLVVVQPPGNCPQLRGHERNGLQPKVAKLG